MIAVWKSKANQLKANQRAKIHVEQDVQFAAC